MEWTEIAAGIAAGMMALGVALNKMGFLTFTAKKPESCPDAKCHEGVMRMADSIDRTRSDIEEIKAGQSKLFSMMDTQGRDISRILGKLEK